MKNIETHYAGCHFRSRSEARALSVRLSTQSLQFHPAGMLLGRRRLAAGALRGALRLKVRRVLKSSRLIFPMACEAATTAILFHGGVLGGVQMPPLAPRPKRDMIQSAMARDAQGEIVRYIGAVEDVQMRIALKAISWNVGTQSGLNSDAGCGAMGTYIADDFPCGIMDSVVFSSRAGHSAILLEFNPASFSETVESCADRVIV